MITKAIMPAAGHGTRMLSLTRSTPKELLPIAGRPMIHHAVQEAADAGIKEIYIVIRKGKESIKDYLKSLSNPPADLFFIYQEKLLGLGDALYCAKDHIGESPFLMVIPDQLLFSAIPASRQLIDNYRFDKPTILYLTEQFINPQTGEVDLLKTFQALQGRLQHYAIILDGHPCDFGTLKGYLYYTSKHIDL